MKIERFKNILSDLNEKTGLNIGFGLGYSPEKPANDGTGLGYMLCKQGECPARKLILVLDQGSFNYADAKAQIWSEVLAFWDGKNTELNRMRQIIY